MRSWAVVVLIAAVGWFAPGSALAQTALSSSPQPVVTADNEAWYVNGEPLLYQGYVFHPVGPQTAFNRNEMVRSGFYRGIPLYTRTTYEPWSVVFVPLASGFMQPYIRRREGEIGGTLGSIGPGIPPERMDTSRALTRAPQAAGPPTNLLDTPIERVTGAAPSSEPVATTGTSTPIAPDAVAFQAPPPDVRVSRDGGRAVVLPRPRPLVTAVRPSGINDVFVEFGGVRWYGAGPAVAFDPGRFRRAGEYRGFPVYVSGTDDSTIYIPVTSTGGTLVAPYSKRR
jgi:hypothetical protein